MVDDQEVRAALGAMVEDWEAGPDLRRRVVARVAQRRAHRRRAVVATFAVVGLAAIGIVGVVGDDGQDRGRVVAGEGDGATVPPPTDHLDPHEPTGDGDLPVLSLDELDLEGAVFDWDSATVAVRHGGATRVVAGLPDVEGDETHRPSGVGYPDTRGGVVYQAVSADGWVRGVWHVAAGAPDPTLLVPAPEGPAERLRLAGTADLDGVPNVLYATGRASGLLEDDGEQLIRAALDGSGHEAWFEDAGTAWEGGVRAARIADGWTLLWRMDSVWDQLWRIAPGADFDQAAGPTPIFATADGDPVRLVDADLVTGGESGRLTVILTTSGPDERFVHSASLRVELGVGDEISVQDVEIPSGGADVRPDAVSTDGFRVVVSRSGSDGSAQPLVYDLQSATWSRLDVRGTVRLVPPPSTADG